MRRGFSFNCFWLLLGPRRRSWVGEKLDKKFLDVSGESIRVFTKDLTPPQIGLGQRDCAKAHMLRGFLPFHLSQRSWTQEPHVSHLPSFLTPCGVKRSITSDSGCPRKDPETASSDSPLWDRHTAEDRHACPLLGEGVRNVEWGA